MKSLRMTVSFRMLGEIPSFAEQKHDADTCSDYAANFSPEKVDQKLSDTKVIWRMSSRKGRERIFRSQSISTFALQTMMPTIEQMLTNASDKMEIIAKTDCGHMVTFVKF